MKSKINKYSEEVSKVSKLQKQIKEEVYEKVKPIFKEYSIMVELEGDVILLDFKTSVFSFTRKQLEEAKEVLGFSEYIIHSEHQNLKLLFDGDLG